MISIDGAEMILVPTGEFKMGTSEAEIDPVVTWYESINSLCLAAESIEIQQFYSDSTRRLYVQCSVVSGKTSNLTKLTKHNIDDVVGSFSIV